MDYVVQLMITLENVSAIALILQRKSKDDTYDAELQQALDTLKSAKVYWNKEMNNLIEYFS